MTLVAFTPDRFAAPLVAGWLVCVAIGCANDRTVESDAMITFETPDGGAAEDASRPPDPSGGAACEGDAACPAAAPLCRSEGFACARRAQRPLRKRLHHE